MARRPVHGQGTQGTQGAGRREQGGARAQGAGRRAQGAGRRAQGAPSGDVAGYELCRHGSLFHKGLARGEARRGEGQ